MDHVAQGRLAKFVGDRFEEFVDTQHAMAKHYGILAHVVHNQAQSNVVSGRLIYTACGVADYTGTCEGDGRSLATEAKSCKEKRFPRNLVKPKQQEHLGIVARAGGLAFLLLEFRNELPYKRFAVPWLEVPWVVKRSAESVSAEELAGWMIEPQTCYLSKYRKHGQSSTPSVQQGRRYARE
jgi:penicillin-binding protein-related factor A (putative recombinase)